MELRSGAVVGGERHDAEFVLELADGSREVAQVKGVVNRGWKGVLDGRCRKAAAKSEKGTERTEKALG